MRGRSHCIAVLLLLGAVAAGCGTDDPEREGSRYSDLPEMARDREPDPYDPSPAPYLREPPPDPVLNQERDLLPETVHALHGALDGLDIDWFISQGISRDPLSAGTHRPDGRRPSAPDQGEVAEGNERRVPEANEYYTAAIDISIAGLTSKVPPDRCSAEQREAGRCLTEEQDAQFVRLLQALRDAGFAAWYRNFHDSENDRWQIEIHAIDPIAPTIKRSLREQLDDYLQGRDGLVRRRRYDAAGRIRPNREAFCRRAAMSSDIEGYVAYGESREPYRSRTRDRFCRGDQESR